MESIGPPSMLLSLVQLESLTIENCKKMQQVISDGSETQEIPKEIITFPKLKILRITFTENLACFYGGSYKMAFPLLEVLHLYSLKRMTKFAGGISSTAFFPKTIEFPCLERLMLEKLGDEVRVLTAAGEGEGISSKFLLSSSSSDNEGCVGSYYQFPKLEQLDIQGCPNSAEQFIEDDGSAAMLKFCGQFRSLKLHCALNMEVESLHLFKSLDGLSISNLTWEYLFSFDLGFEQLQSLERLVIQDCQNLKVIIRGGDIDKAVVFPQLELLYLENLERMSNLCSISDIPFRFPSLTNLYIHSRNKLESLLCEEANQVVELLALVHKSIIDCSAMKSFSTRPLKAPKLRDLTVSDCPEMEWFLLGNSNYNGNAVLELPSLENVTIKKCPNMKSFSPALLRAPKLRQLELNDNSCRIFGIQDLNYFLQSANSSDRVDCS